jgi:hypothetical protein
MKTLFLTCIACLFFALAKAQETKPADSLYIVTYTTGSAWDASKAPHEQPYFKEHSANLGKLRKEGVIKAGARYADKGIIFIRAASLAAAKEIILADQGVVNKLFNADVQKMNLFYEGCLEKIK